MAKNHETTVVNKQVLVNHIASQTGLTKKAAAAAFDALFDGITNGLAEGLDVSINGYLKINVVPVPERTARNPQNGETVVVPAGYKLRVKAMSKLKAAVRGE